MTLVSGSGEVQGCASHSEIPCQSRECLSWSPQKWYFPLGFLQGVAKGGCIKHQKMLGCWNKLPNVSQHPDPKLVPSSSLPHSVAHSRSSPLEPATLPCCWAPRNFVQKVRKTSNSGIVFFSSRLPMFGDDSWAAWVNALWWRQDCKTQSHGWTPMAEAGREGEREGGERERQPVEDWIFSTLLLVCSNCLAGWF